MVDICERCGEILKPNNIVWLELEQENGLYFEKNKFPVNGKSQGLFTFGKTCAKNIIKNKGEQDW